MGYLTLGTWTIPYAWVAFLLTYLYIDIRNRKAKTQWPNAFENLLFVYLISWKASYILFYWEPFLSSPLSILYFDGGWKGHLIALAITSVIFIRRKIIVGMNPLLELWLQFIAMYYIIFSVLAGQYIIAAVALIALFAVEKKKEVWAFALISAVIVIQGDWYNSFLLISAVLFIVNVLYLKKTAYIAPVVMASLMGIFIANAVEINKVEEKIVSPIELQRYDGGNYSIRAEDKSLVVVNFFATWCPPCKAEMPHLQSFANNLPEDVQLIGVNLTARDDGKGALSNFIEEYNVTYPILLDYDDRYGKQYRIASIPTTIVLKNGNEIQRIIGPISEEGLRKVIMQYKR